MKNKMNATLNLLAIAINKECCQGEKLMFNNQVTKRYFSCQKFIKRFHLGVSSN